MATHSSILVWRIHEQRPLVGCSPWGHTKLDTTEQLTLSLSKIRQEAGYVLRIRGIHMHSMAGMTVTAHVSHNMWNVLWQLARGREMIGETQGGGIVSVGVEYHSNSLEIRELFSLTFGHT